MGEQIAPHRSVASAMPLQLQPMIVPNTLRPGDALDFWRVETVEAPALLRLRAEMKVPGRAWLQFEVRATQGSTLLAQTAIFAPKGLAGLLYWYALYPVHALIFSGLVRRLAARAAAS